MPFLSTLGASLKKGHYSILSLFLNKAFHFILDKPSKKMFQVDAKFVLRYMMEWWVRADKSPLLAGVIIASTLRRFVCNQWLIEGG